MDELHAINRAAIFDKLSKVRCIDNTWIACDVIKALSESIVSDTRLINNFNDDEMIVKKLKRKYRCLTIKGIEKYLNLGKCYSYNNACAYFKIEPINKNTEKFKNDILSFTVTDKISFTVTDNNSETYYTTKKILRWLCDKRKQDSTLSDTIAHSDILYWCKHNLKCITNEKFEYLKRTYNSI